MQMRLSRSILLALTFAIPVIGFCQDTPAFLRKAPLNIRDINAYEPSAKLGNYKGSFQTEYKISVHSDKLIFNSLTYYFKDTNNIVVLDGIIIDTIDKSNYRFNYVYVTGKTNVLEQLGLDTNKSLVIINSKNFEIENQLSKVADSLKKNMGHPDYIKYPIILDKHLVRFSEKYNLLHNLTLDKIIRIKYISKEEMGNTLFGAIELHTK